MANKIQQQQWQEQERMEEVLRDMAAAVISSVHTRIAHPTYIGKGSIRTQMEKLEGALALYGVLSGQAMHYGSPTNLLDFRNDDTVSRVAEARHAVTLI